VSGVPDVNALVLVAVGDGAPASSRVEDEAGGELALAAPRLTATQAVPVPGEPLRVSWSTARGLMVLPVVFSRGPEGSPAVWWVQPTGPAAVEQRRSFVRAGVHSPAHLDAVVDGQQANLKVTMVDLSEGGARLIVESDEPPVSFGDPVSVRFGLDDEIVVLPGWARRCVAAGGGRRHSEVAVEFRQPVPVADRLRRYVFAQQLRERRMSR
jgi:hypothetical protein